MNYIATQNNNYQAVCTCPHCNSASLIRFGFDRGTQRYRCKNCCRTFKATAGTPVHGLHKKEKIAKYLEALRKGTSVRKAAKHTGISKTTSFAWRHKFLASLNTQTVVHTTNETASVEIIQLEYSAKGRRKPPEKHTSPTKTIALLKEEQLELHKLPPVRQVRKVTRIFTENSAAFIAASPNKTVTISLKHSENTIKIKNKKVSMPLLTKAKKQTAKLLSWIERFKGVASKYLQNYWNWYATLQNCGQLKQEAKRFCELCTNSRSLDRYFHTKEQ